MTLKFLAGFTIVSPCLDISKPNPLAGLIVEKFGVSVGSFDFDIDRCQIESVYNTIFLFETIEHCMNPLALLDACYDALTPNGTLFLSTPVRKPNFLQSPYHFAEYDRRRMAVLLKKAGLKIIKRETFRIVPFWWGLYGIRPALRTFFERVQIYALKRQV